MKTHITFFQSFFATLVVSVLLIACGGAEEESATLKQARKVQHEIERLGEELHEGLAASLDRLQEHGEIAVNKGDSALAHRLHLLEASLRELDGRFHTWSDEVVPVPGATHHHDHGTCDHDHSKDHALDGLPEDEVLAIQSALKSELDSMSLVQLELEKRLSRIIDLGDEKVTLEQ